MSPPITKRRLFGIDRSGPAPVQTRSDQPLHPWTIPNAIRSWTANSIISSATPDISARRATSSGWSGTGTGFNTRTAAAGFPGSTGRFDGSFIPFARSEAEGRFLKDPRPSLEERYGGKDAYVAKLTAAAQQLVAERLLLQEDADRYVEAAKASAAF